jgi:GTP-binding protein
MNRIFHEYGPIVGRSPAGATAADRQRGRQRGCLCDVEPRGARADVHDPGVRPGHGDRRAQPGNDLEVNVLKGKQLTNIRAAGKDEAVRLTPPRKMSLEQAIAYIEEDELVEITPKSIRLRKRFLNPEDRKRARKQAAQAAE